MTSETDWESGLDGYVKRSCVYCILNFGQALASVHSSSEVAGWYRVRNVVPPHPLLQIVLGPSQKASSEQNQYHGEVGCKNHHSSARRFKGTPNLNDKIPPKVESPKPNQENKWALIKTNKPPRTKPGQQPRPVFTLSQTSINNPFKRCFYSEQYRYLLNHIFQVKTSSQRCQCFLRSFCFSPC